MLHWFRDCSQSLLSALLFVRHSKDVIYYDPRTKYDGRLFSQTSVRYYGGRGWWFPSLWSQVPSRHDVLSQVGGRGTPASGPMSLPGHTQEVPQDRFPHLGLEYPWLGLGYPPPRDWLRPRRYASSGFPQEDFLVSISDLHVVLQ